PNSEERVGYVPNVVYSCGSIIHNDELIIAYGMSDYSSGFAVVPLNELMYALLPESFRKKYKPVSEKQVSILVVEDDPNVQKIIHRFLTEEGHEITLASDGIDALMRVGKHKFDLIVSDILMPNLNGIQLLEQLNQKGVRIPVMFITGYHNLEYELKSKELGAVGYIKKPINKDVLIKKVHQLIDFAL
ncbi:MAG: response regulator, partial [bacterium]